MTQRENHKPGATFIAIMLAVAIVTTAALTLTHPKRRSDHLDPSTLQTTRLWPDMRIELNLADEHQLTLLPSIGPRLARRIVEDRDLNGPFSTLAEVDRVFGIGPRTLERIGEFVVFEPGE